jgi:pyruvate/2-oxoglutarate dehydrogenase complex dihydrolipoamide acyltransferase (E2) component
MPTDVVMPQMGESIFEGTITKWLKKAGDSGRKDEPLFEISTDKVDAEIPSPVAGVLTEIRVPEGATVEMNTIVAVIGGARSRVAGPPSDAQLLPLRQRRIAGRNPSARLPRLQLPSILRGGSLLAAGAAHRQRKQPRPPPDRRQRRRRPHHQGRCAALT